ncbi:MAG: cobalt ECF transporter T component CbiQ [Methanobrevibacter sp.]|jgi:cobalt/nickel transport system permease protein|nr:cobalt ECF transporter T component CbiQ [Candidatus Methanovirga australis]
MKTSVNTLEREARKKSAIHNLDSRIKLIMTLIIIVYGVYTTNLLNLLLIEIYIIFLVFLSKISLKYYLKRIVYILPFGGFIAIFQPFIRPGDILYTLPFGLSLSYQGVQFGILLLSRLTVSISMIVLFSSSTPMNSIINAMRRLGFPKVLSMILSLTVRYLFVFFDELDNIRNAQKSRCFNIWNHKISYMWILRQLGYTIMMIFLNSFEKGEKIYFSMLSRGYNGESNQYIEEPSMKHINYFVLILTIAIIIFIELK